MVSIVSPSPAFELLERVVPMPQPFPLVVRWVSGVHLFWRINTKSRLYIEPRYWGHLLLGHGLNQWVTNGWIRFAAHLLLVVTRVEECVEKFQELQDEIHFLRNAVEGVYGGREWVERRAELYQEGVSEWKIELEVQWMRLAGRTYRTFCCSKRTSIALFVFIMKVLDVVDALFRSEEGMQELFLNLGVWFEKVTENRELFLNHLKDKEGWINELLEHYYGINWRVSDLIRYIEPGFVLAERAHQADRALGGIVAESWLEARRILE